MGYPKIVPKGNLSEMVSNWQISIGYEDNQIMTIMTFQTFSISNKPTFSILIGLTASKSNWRMDSPHLQVWFIPSLKPNYKSSENSSTNIQLWNSSDLRSRLTALWSSSPEKRTVLSDSVPTSEALIKSQKRTDTHFHASPIYQTACERPPCIRKLT